MSEYPSGTHHTDVSDPPYVLGRTDDEARRLEVQAAFFELSTRQLLQAAGITNGMKVLDIGSGAGDVTLLAAELVGPTGEVVGLDINPQISAAAARRAAAMDVSNASFVVGDIRETDLGHEFDAVVGRLVLMYSADPAATLRAAVHAISDDGLAVFYEMNVGTPVVSLPPSPLHQALGRWLNETFARSGAELAMGTRLHDVFVAAGLESPIMSSDVLTGAGPNWVGRFASAFGASLLRSMLPSILYYDVATELELALDTFDDRYVEEVVSNRSVVQWLPCVGAWAHKRKPTSV